MSITLEEMCPIYKALLPHFQTLVEEANHYGVTMEVSVSPTGDIFFTSKEKVGDSIHFNQIKQGKTFVGESSMNYKMGNKTI